MIKEMWLNIEVEKVDTHEGVIVKALLDNSTVTNFIWTYFQQFFNNFYSLNGTEKPLKRPFDQYQIHFVAISISWAIRQSVDNLYGTIY